MCGIVGIWGPLADKSQVLAESCRRIRHRGPGQQWLLEDAGAELALAHVRLAIQDLTEAGHQPMVSACGRYVMVFNGEIYNHLDMRKQLEQSALAPPWRGHLDTETLLAGFSALGIEATLQAAVGMFAIACGTVPRASWCWRATHGRKAAVLRLFGRGPGVRVGTEG